jgi:sugar O-acyltransferase (sialic acid O-acetyltransferase NeuD family)
MTFTGRAIILGAGGHAGVLIDTLQERGDVIVVGLLTPDHERWGKAIFGVPILGGDDLLNALIHEQGVNSFVVGVGSIGDTSLHRRLFEHGLQATLKPLDVIHPKALISRRAVLNAGVQVMAGSVINTSTTIGTNVVINTGAIVEHDCWIGNHAHIASGARLAGQVRVETGVHVGIGATIRQNINIGADAIIGAGAVVVKDVAAHTVVVGVPAKVLRSRSE